MPYNVSYDQGTNRLKLIYGPRWKGLDSKSEPTATDPDHLADIQNVDLRAGTPNRMGGFADTLSVIPAEPTLLAVRYPSSSPPPANDPEFISAARDGHVYFWINGTGWVSQRRGLSTSSAINHYWTATQLADYLVIANKTDGIFKWDGTRVLPIGAKYIADMEITGGEVTWAGSGVTETTLVKEGTESRKLTSSGAAVSMTLTPATAWDLINGLLQAKDYTTADYINFWVNIDDVTKLDTATTYIRFGNAGDTIYFQLTAANWGTLANGWNQVSVLKSAFTLTGAAVWSTIAKMTITTDATGANTVVTVYDDVYMIYASTMPKCQYVVTFKNMLIGAHTTLNPSDFHFSKVSAPDEWDASAVFPISENDGQVITGMHPYYNQIVIPKDNSVHSVGGSVAGTVYPNYRLEHLLVTTEHGCTSHRSMVEAGNMIYMWWRNEVHRYKGVGTEKVSYRVDPTLNLIETARVEQVVATRHRTRNKLHFVYTPDGGTQNTLRIDYDYVEDGWAPVSGVTTAVAAVVYLTGGQEFELTADYSGNVEVQDNGTTFDGTAITAYITLPWASAQQPDTEKMWDELYVPHQTNTGSLVVEYRIADHPREFDAASYVTADTINMATVGNLGRVRIGNRSRWIQIRLRTVGALWIQYGPLILYAKPLERPY